MFLYNRPELFIVHVLKIRHEFEHSDVLFDQVADVHVRRRNGALIVTDDNIIRLSAQESFAVPSYIIFIVYVYNVFCVCVYIQCQICSVTFV